MTNLPDGTQKAGRIEFASGNKIIKWLKALCVPAPLSEEQKRKNFENFIRPSVKGDAPELIELGVKEAMEDFDRYVDGRIITATEVHNFLKVKAEEQARTRFVRLSDTEEIQLAFQREWAALINEAGAGDTPPTSPMPIPTTVTGIIDGRGLRNGIDGLEKKGSLQGFKPEHIRVLKTLAFLLGQCARLEATKQNLAIFEPMFHPAKPTTPTVADAMEEVVAAVVKNIEPTN